MKELKLIANDDGVFEEYDDTYDLTIHCTSQEEQDEVLLKLNKTVEKLPPVKPEQKWIPVSERLPELNKPLLVTSYGRVCYAYMISESGNWGYPVFRLHEMCGRSWVQETISHEPYSTGRIDAWMYLDMPEPYVPDTNIGKMSEIPTGEEGEE